MRKEARQKEVKLRKNFFPTLLITILLWGLLGGLVYFVDPSSPGAVLAFFVLVFLSLLFTFSILLANSFLGGVYSLMLTLFALLRYFGVGNVLNLLLILGILAAVTIVYFKKT
jgi:hypothetical protein